MSYSSEALLPTPPACPNTRQKGQKAPSPRTHGLPSSGWPERLPETSCLICGSRTQGLPIAARGAELFLKSFSAATPDRPEPASRRPDGDVHRRLHALGDAPAQPGRRALEPRRPCSL